MCFMRMDYHWLGAKMHKRKWCRAIQNLQSMPTDTHNCSKNEIAIYLLSRDPRKAAPVDLLTDIRPAKAQKRPKAYYCNRIRLPTAFFFSTVRRMVYRSVSQLCNSLAVNEALCNFWKIYEALLQWDSIFTAVSFLLTFLLTYYNNVDQSST